MSQVLLPLNLVPNAPGTPVEGPVGPQGPAGPSGSTGPAGPPGSGGGDGYGSNVFIYQPFPFGPTPPTNTFITFQEAYDAAIATAVPATIVFDDTHFECDIFAGTYDLSQITLQGRLSLDEQVVVFIKDQVIFTGLYKVNNIALLYDGTSNPLITFDGVDQLMYMENGAFITTINTSPFYSFINSATITIHLGINCNIQPSTSNPVIILDECEISINLDGAGSSISNDAAKVAIPGNSSFVELQVTNAAVGNVPSAFIDPDIDTGYDSETQALYIQPLFGSTSQRPTDPFVRSGMMFYDDSLNLPIWWDGSQWKESNKPYLPEYLQITIDSPQTTGLVTGGHINFNTPIVSAGNTYGGYSSPGTLFVNFNDSTQGINYTNVGHKLVANLGDFDGTIIYQWWDKTNDVGLGNIAGNAGNAKLSDAVAFIPNDYMHNQNVAVFIELRLLFVGGTTAIGENTSGGFILPWATMESIGTPVLT